jgi:hypothetical protein
MGRNKRILLRVPLSNEIKHARGIIAPIIFFIFRFFSSVL